MRPSCATANAIEVAYVKCSIVDV